MSKDRAVAAVPEYPAPQQGEQIEVIVRYRGVEYRAASGTCESVEVTHDLMPSYTGADREALRPTRLRHLKISVWQE